MKRFELTEDMLTGIPDIDAHHRTLLELGNRVMDTSIVKTGDKKVFDEALQFLADYVIYHFAAEEYVMSEYGYPHDGNHRQWHERFKGEVLD